MYFSQFPSVYVGEGITDEEAFKYKLVTNIFRRVVARDDLSQYTSLFEAFEIPEGVSPPLLADALYEEPTYDWIILLANNITNVYDQWPKDENTLIEYVNEKYDDPDSIHHYETLEVKYNGAVFVEKGIEVNSNYTVTLPDDTTLSLNKSRYPVTNYEHEAYLNELKRQIVIPNATMFNKMLDEFPELIAYNPHPELDDQNNKKTELSIVSKFLTNSASAQYRGVAQDEIEVTSFGSGEDANVPVSSTYSVGVVTGSGATSTTTTTTSTSSSSSSGSSGSGSGSGGGSGY